MSELQRLEPGALFSGAVIHGDTVYLSGKVASDTSGGVAAQTKDILDQIDATLAACGTSKSKLLTVMIWLTDMATWAEMNEVYTPWIDPDNKPCRACVGAPLAAPRFLVEIQCVAAR